MSSIQISLDVKEVCSVLLCSGNLSQKRQEQNTILTYLVIKEYQL
jgi:hypothetical protein